MAINPEKQNPAKADITVEQWTSTENKQHLVSRKRLTTEWEKRAKNNRLDAYWTRFPLEGKKDGTPPFQVGEKAVPSGNGMVTVEWTVWEKSDRLHDKEVEFYSVIRAEKHFIDAGYKKLSSKYSFLLFGRVPIEDCGVDNFFYHPSKNHYVFCESKFTRDEALFKRWKANEKLVWARLSNYRGSRQMGWAWIQNRAKRAYKKPSGLTGVPYAEKLKIVEEVAAMKAAADRQKGTRWVNVYGADYVPVGPGVYSFTSGEAGVGSSNELVVDWPFTPAQDEFIELKEEFDTWAAQRTGDGTAAPVQGSGG